MTADRWFALAALVGVIVVGIWATTPGARPWPREDDDQ